MLATTTAKRLRNFCVLYWRQGDRYATNPSSLVVRAATKAAAELDFMRNYPTHSIVRTDRI